MKKFLLIVVLFLPLCSIAQSKLDSSLSLFKYNNSGKVYFQKDIESDLTKEELFKNAKRWIAINYKDYNSVIKIEDEKNGLIIYKGISAIKEKYLNYNFEYTVEINIKDKKLRAKIFDIGNLTYSSTRSTPIEETLNFQKNRTDSKRENGAEFIDKEYFLFTDLVDRITKAMIIKDDF